MTYVEVNWKWARSQLKEAGLKGTPNGELIESVLDTLDTGRYPAEDLNALHDIFSTAESLFKGHPIVISSDEDWEDVVPGEVSVRDTVRVRYNAYDGQTGIDHNTKRGRITLLRGGAARVLYDGDTPDNIMGHSFEKLQKLKVE